MYWVFSADVAELFALAALSDVLAAAVSPCSPELVVLFAAVMPAVPALAPTVYSELMFP